MKLETSHDGNWGGRQASLFTATLEAGLDCDEGAWVQVEAADKGDLQRMIEPGVPESGDGALLGASEVRPVARSWLKPPNEGGTSKKKEDPMPLKSSALEWFALGFSWPKFGIAAFYLQVGPLD